MSKKIIGIILLLLLLKNNIFSQNDTTKSDCNFLFRFTTYYNYKKVAHQSPVLSIEWNKNNLFFGPEYSYIFQPTPIADIIYEQSSFGVNFGYRYYSNKKNKIRWFGQFNYSIYQIMYKEYQLGPPFSTKHKRLILENTVSLGIEYKVFKHLRVFSGVGIGSYDGFFLMINSFTSSAYFGLEYKLK